LQGIRPGKGTFFGGNGRKKYFCIDLRILKKIHIGFTLLQTPCLPHRGRWPSEARTEGVLLERRDTPPVGCADSPLWEGAKIRYVLALGKVDMRY
jgi:hypothetical protein